MSLTHKAFQLKLVNNWKMTFAWSQNSPGPSHITSHALKDLSYGTFQGLCQVKYPSGLLQSRIIWIEREPKVSSWRSGSILHLDCGDLVRLVSKVEAVLNHDMWCCLHIHICRKRNNLQGKNAKKALYFAMTWDLYILVFYILWPLSGYFFRLRMF